MINRLCQSFEARLRMCIEFVGNSISRQLHQLHDLSDFFISNERYHKWSDYEDELLMNLRMQIGNQWEKMEKHFPDRDTKKIKNRWYSHLRYQLASFVDGKLKKIENVT